MLLIEIVSALNKENIPFAIVGGYALALHGIVRATMDVDLVLNLKLSDFENAENAIKKIGLQSRLPIRAQDVIKMRKEYIKNRNLIAWSFVDYKDPSRQLDILINKTLSDVEIIKLSIGGQKVPVASLKTLLEMKQEANRPQDKIDIDLIKAKINEKKKTK